jgi:uncharacterized protein
VTTGGKLTAAALFCVGLAAASFWAVSASFDSAVRLMKEEQYSEATAKLKILASLGHSKAQYLVGEAYAYGRGVTRNRAEALKWFRRAAFHADNLADPAAYAAYYVGENYRNGDTVSRDLDEANYWTSIASTGGFRK